MHRVYTVGTVAPPNKRATVAAGIIINRTSAVLNPALDVKVTSQSCPVIVSGPTTTTIQTLLNFVSLCAVRARRVSLNAGLSLG
ncbi:hypothetical protein OUZ56_008740 [Daphnia magna]|uniref:Uncharacterized protein n=1 Tax=Daphnia magna TaxID=35525 RepID=A0ABR0AEB0_9CRUS|nr:hypothetical protein OUZ56_008740 [Daphnia magna]